MDESQEDHQYAGKKRLTKVARKPKTSTKINLFKGRRCFICNKPLKGNTCQLTRAVTKMTNTPFAKCLKLLATDLVITDADKSCQQCASLVQQRDKLFHELERTEKIIKNFLIRRQTLLSLTNRHATDSNTAVISLSKAPVKIAPQQSLLLKSEGLKQHAPIKSKAPIKPLELYQCTCCQHMTTDISELKSHICKTIENKAIEVKVTKRGLNIIGTAIKDSEELTILGDNSEKLTCSFCDMGFISKQDLIVHNRIHNNFECKVCHKNFLHEEVLKDHEKSHQMLVCLTCESSFPTMESLNTHLTPTLKINTNHCSVCNISFTNKEEISTHFANVHQTGDNPPSDVHMIMSLTYVCACCQIELDDYKDFSRHKEHHISEAKIVTKGEEHGYAMELNDSPETELPMIQLNKQSSMSETENKESSGDTKKSIYECAMCPVRADNIEKLMEHFKTHKSAKISCKHCKIVLPSINALSKHLQYHTKLGQGVECQLCKPSVTLTSKDMLMKHMADLHKMKHDCNICGEQFRFHRELVSHYNQHPESKKFGCQLCGERFLKMGQLQKHVEMQHRDPKCRLCSKVIKNPAKLRQHEARHRNENFPCTKCERIFKTPSGLRNHMASHTGDYKYRCDTCERGFMNRTIFIEHTNNHLDIPKPLYKCDVCNKNFFYQGSLWIHKKWHNNPYPYECKLCGKKLRHASVLQVHMRKHRGERPYKCPYCILNFNSPSTFKRHLMLHTGEYSHKCEDCNKGFTGKNKYQLHRQQVHGEPIPKKPVMTAEDFKVNVPVHSIDNVGVSVDGHPTAYIVENMVEGVGNDELPRVVEVVIDEEQQAVSSITLLRDPSRWN